MEECPHRKFEPFMVRPMGDRVPKDEGGPCLLDVEPGEEEGFPVRHREDVFVRRC